MRESPNNFGLRCYREIATYPKKRSRKKDCFFPAISKINPKTMKKENIFDGRYCTLRTLRESPNFKQLGENFSGTFSGIIRKAPPKKLGPNVQEIFRT